MFTSTFLAVLVTSTALSLIDPNTLPKFTTNLKLSFAIHKPQSIQLPTGETVSRYTVTTKKIQQQVLPDGYPTTGLYAYGGDCIDSNSGRSLGTVYSWPGPAFILYGYGTVEVTFINSLTGKHMFAIEKNLDFMYNNTIDWNNFIPNVVHIHGMINPPKFDGVPEAWFTSNGLQGKDYYTLYNPELKDRHTIRLANIMQGEATLFYHDHSIAMTRLNVMAGLAGFCIVHDPESYLSKIFDRNHDIFLAIADRMFNVDGSLYYPSTGDSLEYPNWIPEFYGDVMVVNGRTYPNLDVERNQYRVRLLNACNSRTLIIELVAEATNSKIPFSLSQADSTYYYRPVQLESLIVPPGGRVELVVDFTGISNGRVILKNNQLNTPFEQLPDTTSDIMTFTPSFTWGATIPALPAAAMLNENLATFPFTAPDLVDHYLTLYEVEDENGNPKGVYINGATMGAEVDVFFMWKAYDLWIINLTVDPHPMHMHLVNFQFYKKRRFNVDSYKQRWKEINRGEPPYATTVNVLNPIDYFTEPEQPTDDVQRVWRDIVLVDPEFVSVLRIRFVDNNGYKFSDEVREGRYVLHCHILEHEDNEMMRYWRCG